MPKKVTNAYAAGISGFPGSMVDPIPARSARVLYGMCPKEKRAERSGKNEVDKIERDLLEQVSSKKGKYRGWSANHHLLLF